MELKINISKTVEQNAEVYFEQAKKYKKKIPGIKKTIDLYKKKLESAEQESQAIMRQEREPKVKKEWFEKFRWIISSDGYLVIGGRDATTNEIVIKKHTDKNDIVFHTELPGSPFVVIKNPDNATIPEQTIKESAELCASFSKSWKSGRSTAEVFYVNPDQVSKDAKGAGSIAKGAFMIYGKRNFMSPTLNLAICNIGRIMCGPISAVKKQCDEKSIPYVEIIQGSDKLSDVAKKVQKIIGGDIDEIIRSLPSECSIKKVK
ncbi:MAG TPA: NFACT RNA binding domain-containing protein [Alphaproteobacteria bacterium]|nr:NFACT RNA binding domain-containing protein [Alphaproteobacteria bacterium]